MSTGQGDDYTARCSLYYPYLNNNYELIAVDLSKQKALDANPRAIQQIVFQEVVGGDNNKKCHLNFRYDACINYRVQIPSETHVWHDNNIQLNSP